MKKVRVFIGLMFVMGLGLCAQANLLQNPGFEEGTAWIPLNSIPGWFNWGGSGGVTGDAGRTMDRQALLMWWTDSGLFQDFPVTAGHTYRFGGYMMHPSNDPLRDGNGGAPGDKTGELHVEWRDATDNLLLGETLGVITKNDPTDTWLFYTADLTAPANAVSGRYLLRMYQPTAGNGIALYDNTSVYDVALQGQAYDPDPADGAEVPLNAGSLSWKNHDPLNPGDTIACDVVFSTDPNFVTGTSTAAGITAGTVALSALTPQVTLADGPIYFWRVNSTDPNTPGSPVTTPGAVWSFKVGDVPAVVDPDVNDAQNIQYTWVDQADADNDPATVSLMLSGSYTDDGKSPIIRAVYEQGAHNMDGTTVVTIGTQTWTPAPDGLSGTVTAPVTITNPFGGQTADGTYRFWLNVEDSAGNSAAEATHNVYMTCLEAATADLDDPINTLWPNGQHGDIDGDCDTDLADFAAIASSWAACMTPKAGCTP